MEPQEQLLRDIKTQLEVIRSHAEAQTSLISSASTYAVGYGIAFGMNFGAKGGGNIVEAALYALLSWVNVGYMLIKHMS